MRMSFSWLKSRFIYVFRLVVGHTCFFVIKIAYPLIRIRIGLLNYARIGHLATNTELCIRRMSVASNESKDLKIFFSGTPPANRQLLDMIRRRLTVVENHYLYEILESIYQRTNEDKVWINLRQSGYGLWDEWNAVGPQLSFTEDEHRRGSEVLDSLGFSSNDTFVCFCARDKAYLDQNHSWRTRQEWSYHDYRNNDINKYMDGARFLADSGITAIRMGSVVEDDLDETYPGIIDYSKYHRSDFSDVYLTAHCKFFLGDTGGLFGIPTIFGVPFAAVNLTPLRIVPRTPLDIFIPKKYRYISTQKIITFKELIKLGAHDWGRTDKYIDAGIEVIENTSEEILDLVMEMNARIDDTWVTNDGDEELQIRYRDLFSSDHPTFGFPSRIGTQFLRKNSYLLE